MIRVICVLARVAPCDVHLARGEINDEGGDRAFTIHRVNADDVVVADRVRQVHMILLDCLQRLDRVRRILAKQTVRAEITHAG